jgi:2-polyprenyl-6-methoxyphenol hydroxylase-like FAD-dependent oxidoreductase
MRILISGVGIAGPTLAYWLSRYGFEPVLIEKSPRLRTAGYIIDFWGLGFDIAERMGLTSELSERAYVVKGVKILNREGKPVAGFSADVFRRVAGGRYVSIQRGALAELIYGTIDGKVATMFGDSIHAIDQSDDKARVTFERAPPRDFDLVIGADGLHSRVRELAFGPQETYEKYLGYKVAAFEVKGYRPREELVYSMFTEVGRQIGRFSMRDDRTLFLFIFSDADPRVPHALDDQKMALHQHFGRSGWECARILELLDQCQVLYFDRISQIRMDSRRSSWSRNRVSLVGDAASCVSLLAGQGTALAMVAAYVLAGELYRAKGDYGRAFQRYQDIFGPFVARKQKAAVKFAGSFAPRTALGLFFRNQVVKLMSVPWIADLAAGRDLTDKLSLPDYESSW